MVRIILNGTAVDPKDVTGEDGITFNEQINDKGQPTKAASSELTFYGAAFQLIMDELVNPVDGFMRTLPFRAYDDCCGEPELLFEGVLRGSEVDWCYGDCFVKATAIEDTETTRRGDCFTSTVVYDNHQGFQNGPHPRMVYCDEIRPEWLHIVLLIMGSILMLMFTIMYPVVIATWTIVSVINLIISAVNLIPGVDIGLIDLDGDQDTNLLQEWTNLRNRLGENLIGCGRRHPSPLARAYVKNVCDKCGLTFQSSILNDPASEYFNTVVVNPLTRKGVRATDSSQYIYDNRLIETGDTFLDKLAPVFNARWRREGSVIRFERRDKLESDAPWIDVAAIRADGRMLKDVCYSWSDEERHAFMEVSYTKDAMDEVGNEAVDRFSKVIEWNSPYSPTQRGRRELVFQFGMPRFRKDGIETDVLNGFAWVPGLSNGINAHTEAMLLSRGVCSMPKLVIWDGGSINEAYVRRYNIPGFGIPPSMNFNYPLQLNLHNVNGLVPYEPNEPNMALYGRFHHIDHPRISQSRGKDFSFSFRYECSELQSRSLFKYVLLDGGSKGTIKDITVNPNERSIFVAGTL